jgi:hypothetical protein
METSLVWVEELPEDTFSRVPKSITENEKLSFEEKGLFAYLFGKPKGWHIHVYDLAKRNACGIKAARALLKALRAKGYVCLVQRHRTEEEASKRKTVNGSRSNNTGHLVWVYLVSHRPRYLCWEELDRLGKTYRLAPMEHARLLALTGRSVTPESTPEPNDPKPTFGSTEFGSTECRFRGTLSKKELVVENEPPPEKKERRSNNKTGAEAPSVGVDGLRRLVEDGTLSVKDADSLEEAAKFARAYPERFRVLGVNVEVSLEAQLEAVRFLDDNRRWTGDQIVMICLMGHVDALDNPRPKGFDPHFWCRKACQLPGKLFKPTKDGLPVIEAMCQEVGYRMNREPHEVTRMMDRICS